MYIMKANHKKKALTFGDFIASIYDTCGKRGARGMARLAVNAHLISVSMANGVL